MSSLTVTIADFSMTSSWQGNGNASTAKVSKSPNISSILAGSTINSAKLSCGANIGLWGGVFSINGTNFYGNSVSNLNVKNCISGDASGFTMSIPFTYKTSKNGYVDDGGSHSSKLQLSNISIVIDYTLPYTACTAPTSVSAANTNVAPGATVRVSWSGASGGTNNPIASYTVYRSEDGNNWTELQSGVANTYLDVTAPTVNGKTYYYAVAAVGTVAGYNSGRSTSTASVKCSFSAPSVSAVKIDSSENAVYKTAGASATLSWTGTNGTNNAISKYKIQRNGTDWQETTETSYAITSHATPGQSYYYTVIPVGAHSNGVGVDSPTLYTYSAPSAPTSVSVEKTNVAPGASVKLSWSGAAAGSLNTIAGYRIMRATSASGTYTQVGSDISSSATSGSVNVTAHSSNNTAYYYKVITLGQRSNSGQSSSYATLTTKWTAPAVMDVKLDGSAENQYRASGASLTLSWKGTSGTNNAITKYEVYQDGVKLGETTNLSYAVSAHSTAGSSHYFQVKPIGTLEDGSLSASIYVYTYNACSAPSSVSFASNNVAPSSSVVLSWSGASAGNYNAIRGYRIMRSNTENGTYTKIGDDIVSSETSGSVSVVSNASNNGVYYYKVITLGERQDSGQSAAVSLTTLFSKPTVTALKLDGSTSSQYQKSSESLTLTWTGTNGTNNVISRYEVYQDGVKLGEATSASYAVSPHPTGGKSYTFTVKAFAPLGDSDLSSGISVYTYTDPSAPTAVSVQANNVAPSATVRLSWSGAKAGSLNAITGYRVMRAASAEGTYTQVGSDISTTETFGSVDVTAQAGNGSSYYYKVITLGQRSNSSQSSVYATLTTVWTAPAVSDLKLDGSSSAQYRTAEASMVLSWTGAAGLNNSIQKYEVYRNGTKLGETTNSSYSVNAHATPGQSYYFQVKAIGVRSDSGLSSSIYAYTYSAPSAPSSVTAANSSPDAGAVTTLSWSGAQNGSFNNIAGYRVFQASAPGGPYAQIGSDLPSSDSSMIVAAPDTMGSSYYYKVMALGQRSNSEQSSAYATVTAKVYTAPLPPSSVTVANATPDAGAATTLSWSGASAGTNNPITGYRVMRSNSQNGAYSQLGADLSSDTASLQITAPPEMDQSYWYKVYTLGTKAGYTISAESVAVQITAKPYGRCAAPSSVTITKTLANPGTSVTVYWSGAAAGRNNPIVGYRVYKSSGGAYSVFADVNYDHPYIEDAVGASGVTYSYKVVTRGQKEGFDSLDSTIVSVKANTKPGRIASFVQPAAIYESGVIRVSWAEPQDVDANIDHYTVQRRIQTASGPYGEWQQLSTVTALSFEDQPSVSRGLKFQYRVCAVDALNLSGDYLETQEFKRNSAPGVASAVFPANGAVTFNQKPYLILDVPAEPDGQSQSVYLSVDGGVFSAAASVAPGGGRVSVRPLSQLSAGGRHTISVQVRDSMGASGPSFSMAVTIEISSWDREIQRGTIISRIGPSFSGESLRLMEGQYSLSVLELTNVQFDDDTMIVTDVGGVSHQSEIEQLYSRVNTVRAYYGLAAISVPASVGDDYSNRGSGKIGMFADWGTQMLALYQGLLPILEISGASLPALSISAGMHPAASVINQIRSAITNL